jgi:hypothetical protein
MTMPSRDLLQYQRDRVDVELELLAKLLERRIAGIILAATGDPPATVHYLTTFDVNDPGASVGFAQLAGITFASQRVLSIPELEQIESSAFDELYELVHLRHSTDDDEGTYHFAV